MQITEAFRSTVVTEGVRSGTETPLTERVETIGSIGCVAVASALDMVHIVKPEWVGVREVVPFAILGAGLLADTTRRAFHRFGKNVYNNDSKVGEL